MWNPSGKTTRIAEPSRRPEAIAVRRCKLFEFKCLEALSPRELAPNEMMIIIIESIEMFNM
tara:strand:+ start:1617 stop:1799 length:183 start_codon:yes stop_codon:yes gene_type:complete